MAPALNNTNSFPLGQLMWFWYLMLLVFLNFWLGWVFVSACGLLSSLASQDCSLIAVWASLCGGFPSGRAQALGHTGSGTGAPGSQAQAQLLWYTNLVAPWCVVSPWIRDQHLCHLHSQVDSSPLSCQGSPLFYIFSIQMTMTKPLTFHMTFMDSHLTPPVVYL